MLGLPPLQVWLWLTLLPLLLRQWPPLLQLWDHPRGTTLTSPKGYRILPADSSQATTPQYLLLARSRGVAACAIWMAYARTAGTCATPAKLLFATTIPASKGTTHRLGIGRRLTRLTAGRSGGSGRSRGRPSSSTPVPRTSKMQDSSRGRRGYSLKSQDLWWVFSYICLLLYKYMCINNTCSYKHTHTHTNTHTHLWLMVCIYVCMYVCMYVCRYVCFI